MAKAVAANAEAAAVASAVMASAAKDAKPVARPAPTARSANRANPEPREARAPRDGERRGRGERRDGEARQLPAEAADVQFDAQALAPNAGEGGETAAPAERAPRGRGERRERGERNGDGGRERNGDTAPRSPGRSKPGRRAERTRRTQRAQRRPPAARRTQRRPPRAAQRRSGAPAGSSERSAHRRCPKRPPLGGPEAPSGEDQGEAAPRRDGDERRGRSRDRYGRDRRERGPREEAARQRQRQRPLPLSKRKKPSSGRPCRRRRCARNVRSRRLRRRRSWSRPRRLPRGPCRRSSRSNCRSTNSPRWRKARVCTGSTRTPNGWPQVRAAIAAEPKPAARAPRAPAGDRDRRRSAGAGRDPPRPGLDDAALRGRGTRRQRDALRRQRGAGDSLSPPAFHLQGRPVCGLPFSCCWRIRKRQRRPPGTPVAHSRPFVGWLPVGQSRARQGATLHTTKPSALIRKAPNGVHETTAGRSFALTICHTKGLHLQHVAMHQAGRGSSLYRAGSLRRLADHVRLLLTPQRPRHMFKFLLIVVKRYTAAL